MNSKGIETRNLDQYKQIHAAEPGKYGVSSQRRDPWIRPLVDKQAPTALLDYGCGSSDLYQRLATTERRTYGFDPAIPDRDTIPAEFFDTPYAERFVLCSHVLEHLDSDEVRQVLAHIHELAAQVLILVPTTAARKILPNGENAHATVKGADWWLSVVREFYPQAHSIAPRHAKELFIVSWPPAPSRPRYRSKPPTDYVDLKGKTVTVVGRAASLLGSGEGPEIDKADIVVRINAVMPLDPRQYGDVGRRTDLVYACRGGSSTMQRAQKYRVPFEESPRGVRARLSDAGGYTPFTGTVAIFDMLERGAEHVHATGMDLYVGAAVTKRGGHLKLVARNEYGFHDPNRDRELLKELLRSQPERFSAGAALHAALNDSEPLVHYLGLTP